MKNSSFKENFAPTVVLVLICLVATFLVAGAYQVTKPVIDDITKKNADAARAEVLADADGFEEMKIDYFVPTDAALVKTNTQVTEVYESTNDTGYVITVSAKGFGGAVITMVGVDMDGKIVGVKVTDASNETPGLGSKATVPDHTNKFVGLDDVSGVDGISGATYTSKAVGNGITLALQQFAELGGAK